MSLPETSASLVHARVGAGEIQQSTVAERAVFESIRLSVHDDLEAVKAVWTAFEKTATCYAFQSFGWQSLWRKHIGAAQNSQPVIVVGREGERILFIFPFAIEKGRLARTLTWHAGDLCDYNGPLLAPDFATIVDRDRFRALFRSVGEMLAREGFAYDAVLFDKMPERYGEMEHPFLALGAELNPSGAYATHLGSEWENFYRDKRSSATRRRDRTKRKRLSDIGAVEFVTPSDAAGISATFATLVRQKTGQLAAMGAEDLFSRPGFADFFRDLATNPETRHLVHVSALKVGDVEAASNLGLVFGRRYYHIFAAYEAGPTARFGPGAAHLHDLMAYAIAQGCTVFDFTIGDEPYKREWSDIFIPLHDHRSGTTLLGMAVTLPNVAVARAKRFVKQTPALWNFAQKARAVLARLKGRPQAAPAAAEEPEKD